MALLVTNVLWTKDGDERGNLIKHLGIPNADLLAFELLKRSVDGRKRPPVWQANYRIEVKDQDNVLGKKMHGVRVFSDRDAKRYQKVDFTIHSNCFPEEYRAIVVGAGPAGLFAALRFAEAGAKVLLLERGGAVEDRHYHVRDFWRHRKLDSQSNVVYGEGGAGAFSDGKIYTRRRDGELGWVFQRLVDFGADPEILEEGWAHLGTDKIRKILPNLRNHIIKLGGEVRFDTAVSKLLVNEGKCIGVELLNGQVELSNVVVMATGHSARDSWQMMLDAGLQAQQRPIRIGARIEHPQKLIDKGRYGQERGDLPPASYRLVSNPTDQNIRGAHTFCMCPGGTVVGATGQEGRVVVNGMSYSGRKAWWANSAIIVEITPEDFAGQDPLAGVRFQDEIEKKAFEMGGADFSAPGQRVVDFLAKTASTELPRSSFPQGVKPSNLWELFPEAVSQGLAEAILFFDRKIPGFAGEDGILIAPETRTTAPLRFVRTDDMMGVGVEGIMPIGEGAGYAGGIASAALEGFRAAQAQIAMYQSTNLSN